MQFIQLDKQFGYLLECMKMLTSSTLIWGNPGSSTPKELKDCMPGRVLLQFQTRFSFKSDVLMKLKTNDLEINVNI